MTMKSMILEKAVGFIGKFVDDRAIAGYALADALARTLREESRKGVIRTIFDIGANKGQWAKFARKTMPGARLVCFEANPAHAKDLRALGVEYFIGALTREGVKDVEFFTTDDAVGSTGGSTYKEKTPLYRDVKGIHLQACSLADLVATNALPQPDLIKIDTQGSELDVIDGGRDVFQNAKYILIEMPVIEYNAGAPSFDCYLSTMRDLGFVPVGISEIHNYNEIVLQIDFLFASRRLINANVLTDLGF